jgi:hypothetical protein
MTPGAAAFMTMLAGLVVFGALTDARRTWGDE